jgi:hypothetical protein
LVARVVADDELMDSARDVLAQCCRTAPTDDDPQAAQWIVRVVLSLAYWPIGDSCFEHQMLERFVSPAFDT